jgi:plexin A
MTVLLQTVFFCSSTILFVFILINCVISASPQNNLSLDIISQFQLMNDSYFTHLTYDKKRSCLYAGSTNRIFQFNKNLSIINQSITGPKPDSPNCHAGGCTDDVDTVETNNHNKMLILNAEGDSLISCGSIHQGSCVIYENLNVFPGAAKPIDIPVVANDENSSSFAFIGPSRYASWKREDILYVGTTFTNVGDYRHYVPAISSRKLDDLNYGEFSIQQSFINIDVKYRDHFLVNYVYGFNTSDYAYFMIVQKKSHLLEEAGFNTRIARICVNDPNYDSYTEITISCLVNGVDFNILKDAKIMRAGIRLSQQMGIKRDDMVLIAVFSPSKEISSETQNASAMCVYGLKEMEEMFSENIHMCFNGTIKDRNLGYISGAINDGRCPAAGVIIINFYYISS